MIPNWSVDLVKYKISHACKDGGSNSEAMINSTGQELCMLRHNNISRFTVINQGLLKKKNYNMYT